MRALTIKRPWDYALLHGKNVENRPARPPSAGAADHLRQP